MQTNPGILHAFIPTVCLITALLQSAFPETLSCGELLDLGDSAYGKFDNIHALDHYSRAFKACPGNYDAIMKMTRALIDAGEDITAGRSESLFIEGLRYADTLRLRYPDSAQSCFLTAIAAANLAQVKTGMRRIPFAMLIDGNIRKSIADAPHFAPAYVVLGAYCREVAVANPFLKMLVGMFFGWMPKESLVESEHALQQALKLDPGNIYAHLELARTYIAMGRKSDATPLLEQIQELPVTWHQDKKLKEQARHILQKLPAEKKLPLF
jgi:FimV-like protein